LLFLFPLPSLTLSLFSSRPLSPPLSLSHPLTQSHFPLFLDGSSYNDGEWWKWQEFVTRVSAHEQDLKDILIQHIEQIALTLRAEGILLLPPIEWDGRLGLEEQRVLDRLGFLLNAYHVEVFYWELVELVSFTHTHIYTITRTNYDTLVRAHTHTHPHTLTQTHQRTQ